MPKKIKTISSIFKSKEPKHHPWQWPSCKHPKTLSFRAATDDNNHLFPPKCSSSFSADDLPRRSLETAAIGAITSGRLFFGPESTRSISKHSKNGKFWSSSEHMFKDSVAMELESDDPYTDFKRSMVESCWDWDWDYLEELLVWYLKMNGKTNHRFIVGAFVDLLLGFVDVDSRKTMMVVAGSDATTTSYSSASSSFSSPLSYS